MACYGRAGAAMIPGVAMLLGSKGAAAPAPAIAASIYSKLYDWWTFNDTGIGAKAGTVFSTGTPLAYSGGKIGNSVSAGQRATGTPSVSGFGAAGCSLFGWVRPTTSTPRVLLALGRNQSYGEILSLDYVSGGIGVGYRDGANAASPVRIPAALNEWHFFVASWKPGTPNGAVELSINAGTPVTTLKGVGSELVPQYFEQGSKFSGTSSGALFDEVGFTIGPLTNEEIAFLYNSGAGVGHGDLLGAAGIPQQAATVWNPADATAGLVITDFNRRITSVDTTSRAARTLTGKASGKWALSIRVVYRNPSYAGIGLADPSAPFPAFWNTSSGILWDGGGGLYRNGYLGQYGHSFDTNDVVTVLYDADAGTVGFVKNGVYLGVAFSGVPAGWKIASYVSYSSASLAILNTIPAYASSNGYLLWD